MAAFSPSAARPLLLKLVRVAGYYGILPLAPYVAFTCQFSTIALRRGAEDERSRARQGASLPNACVAAPGRLPHHRYYQPAAHTMRPGWWRLTTSFTFRY